MNKIVNAIRTSITMKNAAYLLISMRKQIYKNSADLLSKTEFLSVTN
jgi:hypothetical protein